MAAITPSIITEVAQAIAARKSLVLRATAVAAGDFVDFAAAGINPGGYRVMRVAVKSGTPGADKIKFASLADGMTATVHRETAGYCDAPDAINECGYLMHPTFNDTVVNLAGGGTSTLVIELIP